MKARDAALQGSLAAVGLVAAYLTWQREPEASATDVVVADFSKRELERVRYDDPRRTVELERGTAEGEPVIWIREHLKPQLALPVDAGLPDGGRFADAGVSNMPAPPVTFQVPDAGVSAPREFRGNELAEKAFEKFAPFRAARALGVLEPARLKELGLENPERKLELSAAGTTRGYTVGTSAQGVNNPYFRDTQDGKVFLVRNPVMSDLEFASTRLVDRRLHALHVEDWDHLEVKVGDQTQELVQVGQKLAPAKTPNAPDDFAKNWHDKIWRLIPMEVLGRGEAPAAGAPKVELKVRYLSHQKEVAWVEIGRAGELYARTEHTAGWVKLPANTGDLLIEAKKVINP